MESVQSFPSDDLIVVTGGAGFIGSNIVLELAKAGRPYDHDKIDRHLRNLPQYLQDRQLFGVQQLMHLHDYPDPRYVGQFYAQSVSIVDFLCREKDTQTFTHFLRDGLRYGYESALQKYYGFRDFTEAERRWREFAFREVATVAGSGPQGR